MANRNFPANKLYNFHVMPVLVDMQVAIGSSGAPTLSGAPGVQSITRLAAGIYRIQLKDNYYSLLGMDANIIEPVTGSAIDPHVGVVGSLYQISTVGNTDWVTAGVPASITPAVGVTLALAADPGVGTGRFKLISPASIRAVELAGQMMNSNSPAGTNGAFIIIRCVGETITMDSYTPAGTNNSATPPIFTGTPATLTGALTRAAADPTSGSTLEIRLFLNNSSVQ